ncbi:hypothetical protein SAMD00019534_043060 [Acytostelium subglobosum LB1]|uniref:hypothetical protein n=1 Tax=Acytostelium subglobosum LB1 TaxID=1410327 RepID=UPI000644B048|nr:hypothetical protein SAMD00019534_043060 [Acytostelium subglobosum LB1]GAM21131.1 hypothetical protein SAMD00019534_043060 [Acytostelium subglobosum LB1]|eukprot:XP_012756265.1 hypothetical protein SAMD00019534_043060 [Acytostelium subglobosum LB1]
MSEQHSAKSPSVEPIDEDEVVDTISLDQQQQPPATKIEQQDQQKDTDIEDVIKTETNTETDQQQQDTEIEESEEQAVPNQTIYVNNLNERPSKKKLTEQLKGVFSKYGTILDIVVSKRQRMKGQAFIVYSDVESASKAMKAMDSHDFLGRQMKVTYCKSKSDAVAKLDGTFVEKKRPRDDEVLEKKKASKKQDTKKGPSFSSSSRPAKEFPPNKILFVENLPDICEPMMLEMLFSQFPGFQSVNMTAARKGVAFIEFDDDIKSGVAMTNLQAFKVTPVNPMAISYAAQ